MVLNINKLEQFSTFTLLKTIILSDNTLNGPFGNNNIFEFEPSKNNFNKPHIVIEIPDIDDDFRTLGNGPIIGLDVDVDIIIRVEYVARDKFRGFYNALKAALEADNTLLTSGYSQVKVSASSPQNVTLFDSNMIEGVMSLTLLGSVN